MGYERAVLTPEAYRLTTRVGFVGVALGIVLYILLFALAVRSGMPVHGKFTPATWGIVAGMVLAMLVCIYLGCVVAAACLASRFLRQGRMTRREALHYALLSRYPRAWYRR